MLNITQPGRKRLHFISNVIQLKLSVSGDPPTMRYRECLSLIRHKILNRQANENDSSKSDLNRGEKKKILELTMLLNAIQAQGFDSVNFLKKKKRVIL